MYVKLYVDDEMYCKKEDKNSLVVEVYANERWLLYVVWDNFQVVVSMRELDWIVAYVRFQV